MIMMYIKNFIMLSGRAKCSTVLDVDEGLAKEDVKRDAKATAGGFNLKLPF